MCGVNLVDPFKWLGGMSDAFEGPRANVLRATADNEDLQDSRSRQIYSVTLAALIWVFSCTSNLKYGVQIGSAYNTPLSL